jgi:hypothetical protein
MATAKLSKNAARSGADVNLCRCGGTVEMKTVFENRKLKHFAVCTGTCKRTARRPRDLK